MKEHALLLGSKIKTQGKRQFVKFRRIHTRRPMEHICLDIKYVWVQGDGRWYYLLSILDVYSRFILIWTFQPNLRQHDVIRLMRKLHLMHNLKSVTIRNDNGSQFIAHKVREYLRQLEANPGVYARIDPGGKLLHRVIPQHLAAGTDRPL